MSDIEKLVSLEVYDPTGKQEVTELHAPRLPSLNGKTICELSNSSWEARRTFPFIRELLQKQFPDLKIIPFSELPDTYGIDETLLASKLKELHCDGAIVGNAA